jgi:methionyl-tRNA formyltransferase
LPINPQEGDLKLQYSPVKQFALEHNIPVLQPVKLSDSCHFLKNSKAIMLICLLLLLSENYLKQYGNCLNYGCFNFMLPSCPNIEVQHQ